MKMARVFACACLALFFSLALHGCDFGEPEREVKKVERAVKRDVRAIERDIPEPPVRKTAAQCNGGHFHCDGGWKEWCKRMKKQCTKKDCSPMCAWSCDSPKCNQQCGPVCNQPACSTRCKGFNTDSCKMKCGKPQCKVVCPKHFCPSEDCAACKTECGKPACEMICGKDEQPCRHVCAQPVCKWECKDPQACPKPKCSMKCKKQPECAQKMHMFSKVPPLEPGETEIVTGDFGAAPGPAPAPASFLQGGAQVATMRVNFTSMHMDHSMHAGKVVLAMVQEEAEEAHSWTREVVEVGEQVTESEASCTNGRFQCNGKAAWCAEKEQIVCGAQTAHADRRQPSHTQGHLQA